MQLLRDTHILLWLAGHPDRLSAEARTLIDSPDNELLFGLASFWEIVSKSGLGCDDFKVEARVLCRGLLDNGYGELPIVSAHVIAIESLPAIHKDPFDRVLVAQATVEGITLLPLIFYQRDTLVPYERYDESPQKFVSDSSSPRAFCTISLGHASVRLA